MQPFSLTAFQLLLQQLMNETDVHSSDAEKLKKGLQMAMQSFFLRDDSKVTFFN